MLIVDSVIKRFGRRAVLNDLSFQLSAGQGVALMGPNGAGKTTLLQILGMLISPDSGRLFWNERILSPRDNQLRGRMGLVGHQSFLYPDLTAMENLQFYARLYGIPHPTQRIRELLTQAGLWNRRHDPVSQFSRGMEQRLTLLRSLVHNPDILLLDEPFTGLDFESIQWIQSVITQKLQDQTLVLFSTHQPDVAITLAHRLLILRDGALILDESMATVSKNTLERYLSVRGSENSKSGRG
jgi:heme exporter protein A